MTNYIKQVFVMKLLQIWRGKLLRYFILGLSILGLSALLILTCFFSEEISFTYLDKIDQVAVTNPDGNVLVYVSEDNGIKKIITYLKENNRCWNNTISGIFIGKWNVKFYENKELIISVVIGEDYIAVGTRRSKLRTP